MSEWISITDDFPQHNRCYKNLTVEVLVKTAKGNIYEAFCYEPDVVWYDVKTFRKIRENVIAWKSKEANNESL